MSRQPYVHIFVHRDALDTARLVLNRLSDDISDDDRRAIADVLDPLPEVDVFGYMPNVRNANLTPRLVLDSSGDTVTVEAPQPTDPFDRIAGVPFDR